MLLQPTPLLAEQIFNLTVEAAHFFAGSDEKKQAVRWRDPATGKFFGHEQEATREWLHLRRASKGHRGLPWGKGERGHRLQWLSTAVYDGLEEIGDATLALLESALKLPPRHLRAAAPPMVEHDADAIRGLDLRYSAAANPLSDSCGPPAAPSAPPAPRRAPRLLRRALGARA